MPPVMATDPPGGKGLCPKSRKSRKSMLFRHHSEGTKALASLVSPKMFHKPPAPAAPLRR